MRNPLNNIGVLSGITALIMVVSLFGGMSHGPTEAVAEVVEAPIEVIPVDEEPVIEEPVVEEVEVPDTINGLLIGFDRSGGLTDVLMVGHVDPVNNQVQIISVPRDLEIYFTDEEFKHIKQNNPKNRILHAKLNNIYSLLGWDDQALQDVVSIVEVITGLEIDYIMTVNIDGFSDMVDAMGGVEFYVPQDMDYEDPFQDLYIHLDEGMQVLDGDKAEQLVRYRKGYAMGDLQRIEVQQEFVAAAVDQVLNTRDFGQITELLTTGYSLIETDFGLVVMLEYAEFFFNLDMEHVLSPENMITIPSGGEKIDGVWFQLFDLDEAHEAVREVISNDGDEVTENGR